MWKNRKYIGIINAINVLIVINVVLWVGAAVLTGHKYEQLFPTLSLLPGAILAGLILRNKSYFNCVILTVCSALASDLIWIIYEVTFIDRTSHNMLPFELIATGLFSFVPGVLGVGVGMVFRRLLSKREDK